MAEVSEVIVARIRCWWTPCPNCTSECRSSRMNGMSRLTASSMSAWVDGPNACRSASRMSRSSSGAKSKKMVRVVRRDEVVDQRDRHPAGLQPDGLLAVLEDAVVLADLAGAAGLAVADVRAGEVLELERDVLGDVADPRPLAEPGDEPAAAAERAGVVLEGRQQRDQRVGEVRQQVGRVRLEHAQVDQQADDRLARPVVRDHAGPASRGCAGSAADRTPRPWTRRCRLSPSSSGSEVRVEPAPRRPPQGCGRRVYLLVDEA